MDQQYLEIETTHAVESMEEAVAYLQQEIKPESLVNEIRHVCCALLDCDANLGYYFTNLCHLICHADTWRQLVLYLPHRAELLEFYKKFTNKTLPEF